MNIFHHYVVRDHVAPFLFAFSVIMFVLILKLMLDLMDMVITKDVDLLVSHQANLRIIDATARALELKPEQVYINIQKYGNTSAASIPMALDEAVRDNTIKESSTVVLAAFGAGLTWGGMILHW